MKLFKTFLVLIPIVLAACSGAPAAQPAPTPSPLPTVEPTAAPTATPELATPTATATQEPTSTSTATQIPVPPTQTPDSGTPSSTSSITPGTAIFTNTPVPPTATPVPTNTPLPPTSTPTATATATPVPDISVALQEGSVARFIVKEQLANLDLPNDVVGETTDISGGITFNGDGIVQPEQSLIIVNMQALKTDSDKRDNFLRENSLESDKFPTTQIVVRETPGLVWPFPTEGEVTFQIVGDMTIRDVTRPVTWNATALFDGGSITGQAVTEFTFGTFEMKVPSVFIVLSVVDNIRLEVDFVTSVTVVE